MTDWQEEVRAAGSIAKQAGRRVLEIYESDFEVEYKTGTDPVTNADREANTFIVDALRKAFPDDGIVAEENADHSDAIRKGRCWYIDPIDGTREFVAKNGEFVVMIGLAVDGAAKVGAVYQPCGDKLYTGAIGGSAMLEQGGRATALKVSDTSAPSSLRLVISRSHQSRHMERVVSTLGIRSQSRVGSVGLKVGMLAEQRADLYVHISTKTSAWDACAPEAVLKAAGGRFTDLRGRPFVYGGTTTRVRDDGKIDLRNYSGILASNDAAYDAVLPIATRAADDAELL